MAKRKYKRLHYEDRQTKNNKDIATKSACGMPQALILYAERRGI